jgi:hypothetical protein
MATSTYTPKQTTAKPCDCGWHGHERPRGITYAKGKLDQAVEEVLPADVIHNLHDPRRTDVLTLDAGQRTP